FLAFSRVPADVALLEVGMGGRLDATNVITNPALCVITPISKDHQEYLGDTLEKITAEKAGIFKKDVVAVIAPQDSPDILRTLEEKAAQAGAPLFVHDRGWRYALSGDGFTYLSSAFTQRFPQPLLLGDHQYANAATAIAVLTHLKSVSYSPESLIRGVREAWWPARLQRLKEGPLAQKIPEGSELWLDGGHNDSAGAALAVQACHWQEEDAKPLMIICGMLNTKQPEEFLKPMAPHLQALAAVAIPEEPKTLNAEALAQAAKRAGVTQAETCAGLEEALDTCLKQAGGKPARILITGSLYLAGFILRDHY
ncbi:MAG: bifunctional folylpolyglutamate synthase/dihydrofolate synthase, partial [Proteobacteria bacterium]|nr:bifunctional folylpolyglutamate synthase/dihydrofolate synthase [Pseudomonadota bacterium]